MLLLVTRPEPDATETARRLVALGHDALVAPMLRVEFLPPPPAIDEPAAILLTSRNGVRALATWPQAAGWRVKPVYVTGRATAEAARESGFGRVIPANGDSADLANFFMARVDRDLRPILYPAARDRTGGLSNGLRANGFDLRTVEAYRAHGATSFDPEIERKLRSGSAEGALFYSRRTAEAFRALCERTNLTEDLRDLRNFVISKRVADALKGIGRQTLVARQPNEEELFSLLPPAAR